jgi:AbrB family looped-hinge helix DNA binding protein
MERTEETSKPVVVQVRERGQLTIPAGIRRKMGIEEGDVFSLIQVGDTLVATRKKLVAQEVATALEGLMREQGVTLADLPGRSGEATGGLRQGEVRHRIIGCPPKPALFSPRRVGGNLHGEGLLFHHKQPNKAWPRFWLEMADYCILHHLLEVFVGVRLCEDGVA